MNISKSLTSSPSLSGRDTITNSYRMDETLCVERLLDQLHFSSAEQAHIIETAQSLTKQMRSLKKIQGKIKNLLYQYELSSDEGIALMCLAEALLRIPDTATVDQLIADKLSAAKWRQNQAHPSFFANAAAWSLLLTGKIYAPILNSQDAWLNTFKEKLSRLGIRFIRPLILRMMKIIGNQFVLGETIESALKKAAPWEKKGYFFSYDMLGEAARTAEDAQIYYDSYAHAIRTLGSQATQDLLKNPSISVKLSALHPRFDYGQRERVLRELPPLLLSLCELAKSHNIGLTIDAEEADRLDLLLDVFAAVYRHPTLLHWEGLGLVIQAYQKRAPALVDWVVNLAQSHHKRIMVRLVKGAYWDAEIKLSQVLGLDYPVFTRKDSTDVSYLVCAKKLLAQLPFVYPQFGTHNAYSVAAILEMTRDLQGQFEFQCLYGMGDELYSQLVEKVPPLAFCRIYAPVGTHKNLLGYLVRRLLENGANTSFIHRVANDALPIENMIYDPLARLAALENIPHPRIPLAKNIYPTWRNSTGLDLSNRHEEETLSQKIQAVKKQTLQAGSIINGHIHVENLHPVVSPTFAQQVLGQASTADKAETEQALQSALAATTAWGSTTVEQRAALLERAAELFQETLPDFVALLALESGKCLPDAVSEVRETIDYCRYYAKQARLDLAPLSLPAPVGETNVLSLHPRGLFICISPWNFPLAIFTGQILAALVTGNTVIAKPAEQTPLIAFQAIKLLHQAGIPKHALHLLLGKGHIVGTQLVSDPRIAGVMFTGSTQTAQFINQKLAARTGPIAVFVAETGGQNAMIVDSSALPEQVVLDIVQSAFNSAGQRCSALRVLFIQEDIATIILPMLKGYMAELKLGNPTELSTDIGPVIDLASLENLKNHCIKMAQIGKLIAEVPLRHTPPGYFFAPCAFEIPGLECLEGEVFGPILHVIRYSAKELDKVMDSIINTGYGLTLGIHSRIETTIDYIASRMPVGNIYINRNMIGAVVGVQPFGGERLSGTGPKAGGPHYLPRLCVERTVSTNTVAVGGNTRLISLIEED